MKTLKEFTEQSGLNGSLVRHVVKQMGGWDSFKESAQDVANNGINGGFHGFIYYKDTVPFAKRNKTLILDLAKEQAADFGSESIYSMIAGFNCLKMQADEVAEAIHNSHSDLRTQVYNALAWYAGEEVCHRYSDLVSQWP